ncbi:DUF3604 domain-containing protein [Candidatus Bathyarchaeota archaeon]|nr:MAG: DUF3604 domain-containing protein [Candidatus Bathyarchaeota archaeon]
MKEEEVMELIKLAYRIPEESPEWMKRMGYVQWIRNVKIADPRDLGEINVEPKVARVCTKTRIRLTYTVGRKGISRGGRILIVAKVGELLPSLQAENPGMKNFVSCSSPTGVTLTFRMWRVHLYYYMLVKPEDNLHPGEKVTVIIGDDSKGGPGLKLREFPCKLAFEVWIDSDGSGDFALLQDRPFVNVVGGPYEALDLIIPSILYEEDRYITAVLRVLDRFGNVVPDFEGQIHILSDKSEHAVSFNSSMRGVCRVKLPTSSFGRRESFSLKVIDKETGVSGQSNPSIFGARRDEYSSGEYRIFWGDLHGHTGLSSAAYGSPYEYYEYGRDVAALDFCALTDHDHYMTREKWSIIREATSVFNEPNRFVTFLGYEWTHGSGGGTLIPGKYFGHKCVYFPTDVATYYSYTVFDEAPDPNSLWRCLKGTGALVIPHHTAYPLGYGQVSGTDWNYHNPEFERLVEIYSRHGSSEKAGGLRPLMILKREGEKIRRIPSFNQEGSVQGALSKGLHLGFVAGSDTQLGYPGNQIRREPRASSSYNGGLTAVYAKNLTRYSIWEALWNRRCYATTGSRIILQFKVNGCIMGEEISIERSEPRSIYIKVLGTSKIDRIVIVKNGDDRYIFEGTGKHEEISIQDPEPLCKETYYYVRVLQEDGSIAWSSPIWVRPI